MASGDKADTGQDRKKPSGKKAKKLSQKEQSERFIEAARTIGIDENDARFERVIDNILSRKRPTQTEK